MFYLHFHIFYNIFWTNLLIQCPVPVFVCFVCALQKKVKIKYAQKNPETFQKSFIPEDTRRHKNPPERTHQGPGRPGGAPPSLVAPPGRLEVGAAPWLPLPPIFSCQIKKPRDGTLFSKPTSVPRYRDFDLGRRLSYLF